MRLECETSFYNDLKLSTDITNAQTAADTAQESAEEAAKTATNFLYQSEEMGLVISSTAVTSDDEVEALTTPNNRVVSDGFDVYADGTTRVAHFGEETIIGETGSSQQVIDSTSLSFNTSDGDTNFKIDNDVAGYGTTSEVAIQASEDYEYQSADDGSLDTSVLATCLATVIDSRVMTSDTSDYVIGATTDNTTMTMRLYGYALDSNGDNTDTYELSDTLEVEVSTTSGVLTATIADCTSTYWTTIAETFAALFEDGCTYHYISIDLTLSYPIIGTQMTLGTRNTESDTGANSVSMGQNNTASGTCSVAMGRGLTVTDDYSTVVGENNLDIVNANTAEHMETAFAVGANNTTPFAVLKNGTIIMSSSNTGRYPDIIISAYSLQNITVKFESEYPSAPFIFLTLYEDNVPDNQSSIIDYGRMQIYLQSVSTTGFVATMVNGSDSSHTFGFSWFAICAM